MAVSYIVVHTVFATKHRAPVIEPKHDELLRAAARAVAEQRSAKLMASGFWWNHGHLLHKIETTCVLRDLIGHTKTHLTQVMRAEGMESFALQSDFWIESVGRHSVGRLVAYIENQRLRHAARGEDMFDELSQLGFRL